jgi:5-methyltetrahydropteroyltriglutamate--homocysteine methyltransferase
MKMAKIQTTVIGSYPKPEFVPIPDWFRIGPATYTTADDDTYQKNKVLDHEYRVLKGIKHVLQTLSDIGVNILTDGEIRRGNYIHYHCRHLRGISFEKLTKMSCRNSAYEFNAPTIIEKIEPKQHFLANEWKVSTLFTSKPVKITIPGPMTIVDTIANKYYKDKQELYDDIVKALNFEIRHLAKEGCVQIQIDEPLLARKPKEALDFGIKNLEKCFAGVSGNVIKTIHICCGYPDKLDETDYEKANSNAYLQIAQALDDSNIDIVSLEDTHRRNNLELFSKFTKTKIILGVVGIARSQVETVEEIKNHIEQVLKHIPPEKLLVAPDCGLGMLPEEIAKKKLKNMVEAVRIINNQNKVWFSRK